MISIFVAKLDFGVDNAQLRSLFEPYGKVNKATVAMDKETGRSRGFGFVEMEDEAEGQAAIQALDGSAVNGRSIAVKKAEDRNDNRNQGPRNDAPKRPDFQSTEQRGPAVSFTPPPFDPSSIDPRKKSIPKDKERKIDNDVDRTKKPKMDAYKKSGKKDRFFDDDDEDDLSGGLFSFNDEEDED